MPPAQAATFVALAVEKLEKRFFHPAGRSQFEAALPGVLNDLLAWLPPARRTQLADDAIKALHADYKAAPDARERRRFADGVARFSARLPPGRAAELAGEMVPALLADATQDLRSMTYSAVVISRLAERLPEGRRIAVAEQLIEALNQSILVVDEGWIRVYALMLMVEIAADLSPGRVEEVREAVVHLARDDWERARFGKMPTTPEQVTHVAQHLVDETGSIEPSVMQTSTGNIPHALEALCLGLNREELHRLKALPALASGLVTPDTLPQPKPLPPQVLVDLLKRPFVVGPQRRAVLNALEVTYDRKFKDVWEFVAFAEKEHPELDLLTPPKRPQVK